LAAVVTIIDRSRPRVGAGIDEMSGTRQRVARVQRHILAGEDRRRHVIYDYVPRLAVAKAQLVEPECGDGVGAVVRLPGRVVGVTVRELEGSPARVVQLRVRPVTPDDH